LLAIYIKTKMILLFNEYMGVFLQNFASKNNQFIK